MQAPAPSPRAESQPQQIETSSAGPRYCRASGGGKYQASPELFFFSFKLWGAEVALQIPATEEHWKNSIDLGIT